MTNTRLTDPEILERRYPVILQHFSLAQETGGQQGIYKGGDGVRREVLFRKDLTLSILTERRVLRPYGLKGGEPGKCGVNLLKRKDGRMLYLGGKCSVDVQSGDVFILQTPGGGAWGTKNRNALKRSGQDELLDDERAGEEESSKSKQGKFLPKGSVYEYQQTQNSA